MMLSSSWKPAGGDAPGRRERSVVRRTQEPHRPSSPSDPHIRRRDLLTRLLALPAALGIALLAPDLAEARNRRRKQRRQRRRTNPGAGDSDSDDGGDGGGNTGGAYSPDAEERAFLTRINNHRKADNRPALSLQDQLGVAAERHSQDQANRD